MTRFIRLTGGETRFMSHTKRPSGPNTIDGVLEVCPLSSGSSSRTPFDPCSGHRRIRLLCESRGEQEVSGVMLSG
jgi:hypothetical protein